MDSKIIRAFKVLFADVIDLTEYTEFRVQVSPNYLNQITTIEGNYNGQGEWYSLVTFPHTTFRGAFLEYANSLPVPDVSEILTELKEVNARVRELESRIRELGGEI